MAGHMPLTNGATAAKETGYRVGKSKKNPIRNAIRHFSRLMHTPAKAKRRLIN